MYNLFIVLFAFTYIPRYIAQSKCEYDSVDFSVLKNEDFLFPASSGKYFYSVCSDCSDCKIQCPDLAPAPIVHYLSTFPAMCFRLGTLSTGEWGYKDNIYISFTGGDACEEDLSQKYKTRINYICGDSNGLSSFTTDPENKCSLIFDFTTPIVCGYTPSSSTGAWVFNYIVLIGFSCYFIIGFIYLKFYKKKEGKETIPNYSFWVSLFSLVGDGIKYFIKLVRGVCKNSDTSTENYAYSNTTSDNSYGTTESSF